jgi:Zn finger protein HypA/HybF involved in hydrogenase expression
MSVRATRKRSVTILRQRLYRLEFEQEKLDAEREALNEAIKATEAEPRELTECDILLQLSTESLWCQKGWCSECSSMVASPNMDERFKYCPVCGSSAMIRYENSGEAEQRKVQQAVTATLKGD